MAGFRMGRGRGSRPAQQQGQYPTPPASAPGAAPHRAYGQGAYDQGAYGQPPRPSARPRQPYGGAAPQQWAAGPGGQGEPEYFADAGGHAYAQGPGGPGGAGGPAYGQGPDPYAQAANNPGHTAQFSVSDPYAQGGPAQTYGQGSTYAAGSSTVPPAGPRLHWKDLLRGILLRPNATFWQMRDHSVWGPALVVTFVYGLLAVFGLDDARAQVVDATLSSAIPYVLTTGVAVVLAGLILGSVTHAVARQFGGDGSWAPTTGLAMLIMSLTDAPRLLFALFLGGTAPLVTVLGWLTWIAAGVLLTSMVSRSHDLPWPRALGASAIQLVALLALFKLGTL